MRAHEYVLVALARTRPSPPSHRPRPPSQQVCQYWQSVADDADRLDSRDASVDGLLPRLSDGTSVARGSARTSGRRATHPTKSAVVLFRLVLHLVKACSSDPAARSFILVRCTSLPVAAVHPLLHLARAPVVLNPATHTPLQGLTLTDRYYADKMLQAYSHRIACVRFSCLSAAATTVPGGEGGGPHHVHMEDGFFTLSAWRDPALTFHLLDSEVTRIADRVRARLGMPLREPLPGHPPRPARLRLGPTPHDPVDFLGANAGVVERYSLRPPPSSTSPALTPVESVLARLSSPEWDIRLVLDTIADVLYRPAEEGGMGFAGDVVSYADAANSYLGDVLRRRTGLPIALCAVYAAVARRVGLAHVRPIGAPGHFMLQYARAEGEVLEGVVGCVRPVILVGPTDLFIDAFDGGKLLTRSAMVERLVDMRVPSPSSPSHLEPTPLPSVWGRMLNNVVNNLSQEGATWTQTLVSSLMRQVAGTPPLPLPSSGGLLAGVPLGPRLATWPPSTDPAILAASTESAGSSPARGGAPPDAPNFAMTDLLLTRDASILSLPALLSLHAEYLNRAAQPHALPQRTALLRADVASSLSARASKGHAWCTSVGRVLHGGGAPPLSGVRAVAALALLDGCPGSVDALAAASAHVGAVHRRPPHPGGGGQAEEEGILLTLQAFLHGRHDGAATVLYSRALACAGVGDLLRCDSAEGRYAPVLHTLPPSREAVVRTGAAGRDDNDDDLHVGQFVCCDVLARTSSVHRMDALGVIVGWTQGVNVPSHSAMGETQETLAMESASRWTDGQHSHAHLSDVDYARLYVGASSGRSASHPRVYTLLMLRLKEGVARPQAPTFDEEALVDTLPLHGRWSATRDCPLIVHAGREALHLVGATQDGGRLMKLARGARMVGAGPATTAAAGSSSSSAADVFSASMSQGSPVHPVAGRTVLREALFGPSAPSGVSRDEEGERLPPSSAVSQRGCPPTSLLQALTLPMPEVWRYFTAVLPVHVCESRSGGGGSGGGAGTHSAGSAQHSADVWSAVYVPNAELAARYPADAARAQALAVGDAALHG